MSSPAPASLTPPDVVDGHDGPAADALSRRRALPLALVVLFLGVVLTWAASRYVDQLESARTEQDTEHAVSRITAALSERVNYYVAHLRATAGLFVASDRVSLFEWERYAATTELSPLNDMGAAGLAYAPRVAADRRADWEDTMFYGYDRVITIRGSTVGSAYPVQFVAPRTDALEGVLGFDLGSSVVRREAIEAATERGDVVLSAPVALQDSRDASPAGLLVLPVFHPAKHLMPSVNPADMVRGVVVLGVRYHDWIASVAGSWTNAVAVELIDDSGDTPVVLVPAGEVASTAHVERTLTVGGRQLRLVFHPTRQLEDSVAGITVRTAGALMTVAFALLTFFLASGRHRALAAAAKVSGALADSERRFALAASATSDGIWEWSPGRHEVFLSARAQQILFGRVLPVAAGWRTVLRCLPPGERRALLLALRGHLQHRQALDVAVSLPDAEGGRRHLLIRGQAAWDGFGRPTRVAGAISDVTPLHARELALERARQFYARVLDFLPHPVLVKSEDHRYVLANRAAGEFLDRPPEAVVGRRTEEVLPGQSAEHLAEDARVLGEGGVSTREFHIVLDNGNERDAIISKAGVAGLEGEPVVLVTVTDVSALRHAERSLKQSLLELDALFSNSPLGMAMVKVNGTIVRANLAFSRMVGVAAEQLPGMRYAQLTPEHLQVLDQAKTIDALRQGVVTPYERAFVRPDGVEVPVVLSGAVMRAADGETAIWTVVEDISERKAAEAALAAAHATNASIVEAMPDMLVQFDEALNLLAVRRPQGLRLSRDIEKAVGLPLAEIVSPKRLAQVLPTLRKAQSSGELQCVEYRAPDPDGRMQDYEARVAPVSTGGLLVVLRNVSELKARERALRESEARFRLMADASPVVIWLADAQLNITYANRAWRTLTGLSLEETAGVSWVSVIHPDDVARVKAVGREARAAQQPYRVEFRVRQPGGRHAWLLAMGEPRMDEQGEVVGFIGVAINISSEKRAQEALRTHRDHLAELVTEKTASLIEAKEVAERANEAKSRFLANMSHELRSPMHAVLSYARLGEDKALSAPAEKLRDYFHRIRSSGDRLLRLVDNLLDLSKLEAGRMTLDMQPLSLAPVVTEVAAEFDGLCDARQIRVLTELDAATPRVRGDAVRMGQVVRNLLSNAIKFSPDGGGITVQLRGVAPQGSGPVTEVSLRVIDAGVGIPETELEAVFDKFVQSSATRTGAGGTGLGLAICREILVAHGGRIRASNVAGGGACFEIVLPVDVASGQTPVEEPKPS
ncbi:MAG: PAS domain S-box protein [Proteobacteria bacterium]|nr:MAG: PAS domain S-box protein [Pseudomonadota bacterium]